MNKSILSNIIFTGILLINFQMVFAQEKLIFLNNNPQIINSIENNKLKGSEKGTRGDAPLELPFVDDFSTNNIFPDNQKWEDKYVFINNSYGKDYITVGVATFDAIDWTGKINENLFYSKTAASDYLTSKAINLNYPGNNTIYLSFYYQPQGMGDNPEINDSLKLEFFSPVDSSWTTQWFALGSGYKPFEPAIVQVAGSKYLKEGFRFRFVNYVSLTGIDKSSFAGNVDHWNIDYVYLNKNRNSQDASVKDIAFISTPTSLFKDFQSIPLKHLYISDKLRNSLMNPVIPLSIRNMSDNTLQIVGGYISLKDLRQDQFLDTTQTISSIEIKAGEISNINAKNTFNLQLPKTDSAEFELIIKFDTDANQLTTNDQVSFTQKLYDYYAYDDGSSEVGYGISGEGAKYAQGAMKYYTIANETNTTENITSYEVYGIQIYFNSLVDREKQLKRYFDLKLWKNDNGVPGDTLRVFSYYAKEDEPLFGDQINKFVNFYFHKPVSVTDTFFIGWEQLTEDLLNIGFDFNTDKHDRLYINTKGEWVQSQIPGCLMIRPLFSPKPYGHKAQTGIATDGSENIDISYSPNPCSSSFTLHTPAENSNLTLKVYSINGQVIYKQAINSTSTLINTDTWNEGLYLLQIQSRDGVTENRKLIISHQ